MTPKGQTKPKLLDPGYDVMKRIRHHAEAVREEQLWLEGEIREARRCGYSLRAIAHYAGVSHDTVKAICSPEREGWSE